MSAQTKHFPLNPFPHDKILNQTKLKAFADDNFDRVENIVGKGEIACTSNFLFFPQCFLKASFPEASKSVIVWEWVNHKTNLLTSLIFGMNAHLIYTHLVVPWLKSNTCTKVPLFKTRPFLGAFNLVFHKHSLLFCKYEYCPLILGILKCWEYQKINQTVIMRI